MADVHDDRDAREQIARAEEAEARDRAAGVPSLFDLRLVIGGLLGLYGAVLTGMGLVASAASRAKAAGVNINLWAGLIMLAAGAIFLAWVLLRPLRAEDLRGGDGDRDHPAVE